MRPHDDDEDHDEDHYDDVEDVDRVRATTDAHDNGDRDDAREKSTRKTNEPTTRNDDSYDCGSEDDRDDSTDNPDKEIPRTTVAITTGGCGLPSGFVGNVRVTTGLYQGPCRVASPSAPAKCRSSPSAFPAWTLCIPSSKTLHIPSHAWLEVGVGKCCSWPPPAPTGSLWCSSLRNGGALRS